MKIAVTGTSGRIGRAIHFALCREHEVVGIDRSVSSVTTHLGEIDNYKLLSKAFKGAEAVVHTAALHAPHVGVYDDSEFLRINIEGTKNVLNAARKAGVKKFIHFSSIHALVHEPLGVTMDENRELAVNSKMMYEQTKAIAEKWVLKQNTPEFEVIVLNPTSVIGPMDTKPSLMGEFMISVYKHTIPGVVPGGYDWVDVRDIVVAAVTAIYNGKGGERYILSGHWLSIKCFADMFVDSSDKKTYLPVMPLWLTKIGVPFILLYSKITNTKPLYTFESLEILQCGNKNISSLKATRELDFNPRPLDQTLLDTYNWFKENNYI
jgi:dihydroflavonol-4-reductase